MERKISHTEIEKLTMRETLAIFKYLWKRIIETKEYDRNIEKLTFHLMAFKELDLQSQEDLQYFSFAEIYKNYLDKVNRSANIVKEALKSHNMA